MYENKIHYISKQSADEKIQNLQFDPQHHIGIIYGNKAKTWLSYLVQIREQYKFPTIEEVFDGYLDWMEDLSWLNKEAFSMFIFDYKQLLCVEPNNKKIVMEMFDDILVWWSTDIEKYCVEGQPKPFNIYMVE